MPANRQTGTQTSRQTSLYTWNICTHVCFIHAQLCMRRVRHFPGSTSHARSHLCFTYIKCSLFPWFGIITCRTIDQCSSMCRSISRSTITLLFCAWIQHGPMLTPGLQLYNCPAYSMQGKWLNKRERRTLCHSSFFFFFFWLRFSTSRNPYSTGTSVSRKWRILNKNPLQKWWRGNIHYICCLCLGWTLGSSTSFSAPHVKGLQNVVSK